MTQARVTAWVSAELPTEESLLRLLADEGLTSYQWANGPSDVYSAHSHSYNKVIYVVRGSITFGLPQEKRQLTLRAGDRLDLPVGVVHEADIGPHGVVCLEAHC